MVQCMMLMTPLCAMGASVLSIAPSGVSTVENPVLDSVQIVRARGVCRVSCVHANVWLVSCSGVVLLARL